MARPAPLATYRTNRGMCSVTAPGAEDLGNTPGWRTVTGSQSVRQHVLSLIQRRYSASRRGTVGARTGLGGRRPRHRARMTGSGPIGDGAVDGSLPVQAALFVAFPPSFVGAHFLTQRVGRPAQPEHPTPPPPPLHCGCSLSLRWMPTPEAADPVAQVEEAVRPIEWRRILHRRLHCHQHQRGLTAGSPCAGSASSSCCRPFSASRLRARSCHCAAVAFAMRSLCALQHAEAPDRSV